MRGERARHPGEVRPEAVGSPAVRSTDAGLRVLAPGGRREPRERPGEAEQRGGEQRGAAAVHGHGDPGGVVAGRLRDGRADRLLQRVRRLAVGRGVPAPGHAGGEHRGVLAGAVLGDRLGPVAGALPGERLGRVQRQVGRVLQGRLVEAGTREDLPRAVAVHGRSVVAGARQREQPLRQVEARAHHRRRLQGLDRRAGPDRRRHLTQGEAHLAPRVEHDEVTQVHRLHEAPAHHLGERHGAAGDGRDLPGDPGRLPGHRHHPPVGPCGRRPPPVPYGWILGRTSTQ